MPWQLLINPQLATHTFWRKDQPNKLSTVVSLSLLSIGFGCMLPITLEQHPPLTYSNMEQQSVGTTYLVFELSYLHGITGGRRWLPSTYTQQLPPQSAHLINTIIIISGWKNAQRFFYLCKYMYKYSNQAIGEDIQEQCLNTCSYNSMKV
jgi:hypothetical protein